MGLVYLALRKNGQWTRVRKKQATMPPYAAIDGPYDSLCARFILIERNKGKTNKNEEPKAQWLI